MLWLQRLDLIEYLYHMDMIGNQCRAAFADALNRPANKDPSAEQLRQEIDKFRRDSMARKYYAPFNVKRR